jgi:hypothetical protein
MKTSLITSLLLISHIAQATPTVLSRTLAALQKIDPDIKAEHYDIARTDLNADGKEDVLALMNGQSGYRGTGGATMFVLKGTDDGFESLGKIMVVNEPIYARRSTSNGYRDLLVTVRRPGAEPGLAAPKFDGKAYPLSPGERTAKLATTDELLFAEPEPPFDKKESLEGISFQVFSPNRKTGNSLTVTPSGLENDNRPITLDIPGIVTNCEIADINVDASPELYVYVFNGSGTSLYAWSPNKKKSLSQITLAELGESAKGYRGGDEYSVVEGIIARRFPIYPNDPAEAKPTGKTRQIQYKLHAGEAGWLLKADKVIEF